MINLRFTDLAAGILLALTLLFSSCSSDEKTPIKPELSIIQQQGYLSGDTLLQMGQTLPIRIEASSTGAPITLINLRIYDGVSFVSVDSGVNTEWLTATFLLTKGPAANERWVFRIRNTHMEWDSLSLNISLDPNTHYSPITFLSGIRLGAQGQEDVGSFFSLSENQVFTTDSAFLFQSIMDLCYYYDASGDLNTLASPGANISDDIYPGPPFLSSWTTRNEARFIQTTLDPGIFAASQNDSLILSNGFVYQSGKRKAKLLQPGLIFSFIRGPYKGRIHIQEVNGTAAGNLLMDIKMMTE
jgi:hypothetical protein